MIIGGGFFGKIGEVAGHGEFPAEFVHEGDIHRRASGVAPPFADSVQDKVLVMDEIPHLLLNRERTVAVVDFKAEALGGEFPLDGLQAGIGTTCTNAAGNG